MFIGCLLISLLFSFTSTTIVFDVKRYSADLKDGNEPYRPVNYFLNKQKKRSICLFMFCWQHYGNCRSSTDCCECKCRNSSTFFSDPLGCREGRVMATMTKEVGKECYYATKKFGSHYVPLFHNQSRFVDIELDLPKRNFQLNDYKTVCNVGAVHDHDFHGHKLLFERNHCSELFQVSQKQGKKYLRFHSTNVSIWNTFRGRLLSLDIDCYSQRPSLMFSSCFLFQVEGEYKEEVDEEEPPEIPAGYACPTATNAATHSSAQTVTNRTRTFSTTSSTTSLKITSTELNKTPTTTRTTVPSLIHPTTLSNFTPTTFQYVSLNRHTSPSTTSLPAVLLQSATKSTSFTPLTKQQSVLPTTNVAKETGKSLKPTKVTVIFLDTKDGGTTIGILTGLGTGLAVVMLGVIIWMLIKKRKEILKSQSRSVNASNFNHNVNASNFNPNVNASNFNPNVGPYVDHSYHYDVPNNNIRSVVISECDATTVQITCNLTPADDTHSCSGYNRQYSYIGEDHESRDNTILLKSRNDIMRSASMSKRPLPEKPMESGNPYYSVALTPEETDKCSDDIYSLYSTIEDLEEF